jgi:hypothetical protein
LLLNQSISLLVAYKFPVPESCILPWPGRMGGATVPKATIHENRQTKFRKDEIGFSGQGPASSPSGDSVLSEDANQLEFRAFVPIAAHTGHDLRALSPGENIRHENINVGRPFSQFSGLLPGIAEQSRQTA